jgi:hypothetical protein
VRSTAAPYTESRLTRSVANERVGFPVVEHPVILKHFKKYFSVFFFEKRFVHNKRNKRERKKSRPTVV